MKTQLIQLEPHDNRISVQDKMNWARTPRILLLWPRRRRTRIRALDLRLLQRHARNLGAQLGLVTDSEAIRQAAVGLGIPVFESATEAQSASWRVRGIRQPRPKRRVPRPDLRALRDRVRPPEPAWRARPLVRVLFFSLAVLAVLLLVSFFIPRAEIDLRLQSETRSILLPVSAGPDVPAVYLSGSLPAFVTDAIVEVTGLTPASGEVLLPDRPARGQVVFRNLTDGPVTVPAGTIVRSLGAQPVRFAVVEGGQVPPFLGGLLTVNVVAVQPGSSGNLPARSLRAIEGALGLSLAVDNPQPTAGGSDVARRAPDSTDRAAARQALMESARLAALAQMRDALAPGDFILPDTLRLEQVLAETADPPEGQAGEQLSMTLRAEFSARYVRAADLEALASAALGVGMPGGFAPRPGSLTVEPADEPVTGADGLTRWTLRATQVLVPDLRPERILALVLGRRPSAAVARLTDAVPLVAPAQVRLWPAWWPWLPAAPFRIQVRLQ